MSDLKSEDLKNEDSEQAEKDIVLSMEKTESGTVEQRTRIDGHHHHKHHSKLYYKFKRTKHKIKKHFRKKKNRVSYIVGIFPDGNIVKQKTEWSSRCRN